MVAYPVRTLAFSLRAAFAGVRLASQRRMPAVAQSAKEGFYSVTPFSVSLIPLTSARQYDAHALIAIDPSIVAFGHLPSLSTGNG